MASFYGKTSTTPDNKFATEIKPARDPGMHELVVKGYDTSNMTMTEAQIRAVGAAIAAKFGGGGSEPF